jgi:hypothetical protein
MTADFLPLPRPYLGQDAGQRPPDPAPPVPRFTPRPQSAPHPQFTPRPRFTPHSWPGQGYPLAQGPQPIPGAARRADRPAPTRQRPPLRPERRTRAIIGDELRIPIMWCAFGACIERYTSADALGEQDLRARALAAGWRYDLLGRLACPSCAQHDETFWITRPPVPAPRRRRLPAGRQSCPVPGWTAPQKCPTVLLWPRW